MSNYTKSTNFAAKDTLASGNPLKIVKGTEIDTEFNNIATAVATKLDSTSGALTTPTLPAGTAQSLLFLNSSKVITTDADLTYTPSSDLFLLTGITLQIANGSALSSLDGITVSSNGKAVTGNANNVADAGMVVNLFIAWCYRWLYCRIIWHWWWPCHRSGAGLYVYAASFSCRSSFTFCLGHNYGNDYFYIAIKPTDAPCAWCCQLVDRQVSFTRVS